ncbi:uncharacterized protein VP01_8385g1 [Puccinia sorghi]|uniref:Uncharacterized protein n=1 Tax=Puccinia sorghi TaxID=27349 RepID=A0A0L6U9I1_9BASI|nr:uncharacterized protein VP01_8385g1 [Puccinia sorghi]
MADRFQKTSAFYCPSMVPVDSTALAEATNSMVKTSLLSITQTEPLAAILIPKIKELIQAPLALHKECRANNQTVIALRDECRANNQVIMIQLLRINTCLAKIEAIQIAQLDHPGQ